MAFVMIAILYYSDSAYYSTTATAILMID